MTRSTPPTPCARTGTTPTASPMARSTAGSATSTTNRSLTRCPTTPGPMAPGPSTGLRTAISASASSAPRWERLPTARSEEHTSELQSLRHLVCRLLLEKQNNERRERESDALAVRVPRYHVRDQWASLGTATCVDPGPSRRGEDPLLEPGATAGVREAAQ